MRTLKQLTPRDVLFIGGGIANYKQVEMSRRRLQGGDRMSNQRTQERDYFSDRSVLLEPYDYFEEIFSRGPVYQLQTHDALMVTGHEEAIEVLQNNTDFYSLISLPGAAAPLPFEPEGDDISDQLEANRHRVFGSNLLTAYDGERHANLRHVASRIFTPIRLKENEAFMRDYADRLARGAVEQGGCEIVTEVAEPFVTLVIADLLGLEAADREKFSAMIDNGTVAGSIEADKDASKFTALMNIADFMRDYIEDRRNNPRDDVLTMLATSTYPDGSEVPVEELVTLSAFLFAAGQDTSAKLIANAVRHIVDTPGLQQQLRDNRDLVPALVEEVLRLEGSTKMTTRVAVRNTRIGDVEVPAGKRVAIALAAANRDPRRWQNPREFQFERPRAREHLSFGRGVHMCLGAPLARAETRIMLDRFLEHTSHIDIDEARHGKPGARELEYEPTWILRGLEHLYLKLQA